MGGDGWRWLPMAMVGDAMVGNAMDMAMISDSHPRPTQAMVGDGDGRRWPESAMGQHCDGVARREDPNAMR